MSTTIDERVVEMRFDNKQFESATQQSLSTLEKLKQSLNLTGASKGLEEVNSAAKKVDMRGLGAAVETVHAKFSALEVMGITALANITNQAVNTGKRLVSALTIEPITTGFKEYETQINAVQTILANTQSKGTTINDVNKALDTLNAYADKTIYNFTEMTRNIGTFTAAGVDLDTSVNAIQGIANLAAVSGSNAQQASTAMYQLSQALASGTVKLMDWNSVVNAGMGGQVFQDALKETARVHGIAIDSMIKENGSFRETLQEGWLTSEILTETLQKFTLTTEGLTDEQIKANREMLKAKGYTEDQIDEIFKLGKTATDAATKVKTFTQLWDVLKEAAQSGWTQTWELLIGDFDEAKNLITPIADLATGFINKISDARNTLIAGAMESPFGKLAEKIEKVTGATEAMKNATKDYSEIVDKVIGGEYGSGQSRWDKLAEEGYDWAKVQNLVNEKLGDSTRHTEQLTEAQDKQQKSQSTTIEQLVKMSDAQLKTLGFTKDEIEAFRELAEQSEKTGIPIKDLIKDMDQLSGRNLLINSFKNAGQGLVAIFKAMSDAWRDIFPPMTSKQLYDIIAALHKFSTNLVVGDETADKLTRTFKGLFALVRIGTDILGGGFKLAFKAVSGILKYFDLDILDVTAAMGDAIVAFREATDISKLFTKGLEFIVPCLIDAGKAVKGWLDAFLDIPIVQKAIANVKDALSDLKDVDLKEVGKNIIEGLKNGLGDGAKEIVDKIADIGTKLLTRIKEILGIHSPSTEFFEIGKNIIQGLVNGLQNGISWVLDALKGIATTIINFFKGIDFGAIFAIGVSAGMIFFVKKIADAFDTLAGPIDAFTDILEASEKVVKNAAEVVKNFAGVLGSVRNYVNAKALKEIAIAIAILVGSIALLTYLDGWKVLAATGVIVAIVGVMTVLMDRLGKLGATGEVKIAKFVGLIWSLAGAVALLTIVAKMVSKMEWADMGKAAAGMLGLVGILATLMLVTKIGNSKKVGPMLMQMAGAMAILVMVAKMIAKMEWTDMGKAAAGMLGLVGILATLMLVTKIGNAKKVGSMLLQMTGAMMALVHIAKIISRMEWADMGKAAVGMLGLVGVLATLMLVTKIGNSKKIGTMLMQMAGSILILTIVAKMIAHMEWGDMGKAAVGIMGLGAIIAGLVWATRLAGDKELVRVGITLIAMSVAIGILAGVCVILGMLNPEHLAKGIVAVGALGALMSLMVAATRNAQDVKGNLIVMTVAIGVMAAAVAALSFIDTTKLFAATGAMAILMGMFSLMTAMSGKATGAMGTLIVMTVAIGVMAGVIYLLSTLPIESTIGSAIALSTLVLALSGSLVLLTACGSMAYSALSGVILLTAMAVPLLAFVGILALMQNIQNAMNNVLVLTAFAGVLTLLLIPLTLIGAFIVPAAMGVAALTAMAIPLLAFVGILAIMQNIENAMANVLVLTTLMKEMTKVLVVLALIGPMTLIGVAAMAGLTALVVGIGALVVGIGALMTKFPELESFVDKGIPILEKLAYGIGSFVANLISGFAEGLTSSLPQIGADLSLFMTNAMPFVTGIKMVDEGVLAGVGILSAAIIALTAADLINGIASFLSGGSSFSDLGAELSSFMMNAMPFITASKLIDPASLEGIKALAEALLILTGANILEGLTSWFAGEASLADFGAELAAFGPGIRAYADAVAGIDVEAVKASATAAKALAEMASALPNSGGFLAEFLGDNTMDEFGSQLKSFGKSLLAYGESVVGIDQYEGAISASVTAAKSLTELANSIPNSGGFLADFLGDNTMDEFGTQLKGFGKSLLSYGESVVGIDQYTGAISASVTAAGKLTELAEAIPNSGGFLSKFLGDNTMDEFGTQLEGFGKSLMKYGVSVSGIDQYTGAITASVTAASTLSDVAKQAKEIGKWDVGKSEFNKFGDNLVKFGESMADFSSKIKGINTSGLTTAISNFKQLANLAKEISGADLGGLKTFGKSLSSVGADSVDKFINAFSKSTSQASTAVKKLISTILKVFTDSKPKFNTAGSDLMKQFVEGSNKQKSQIKTAFLTSIAESISVIRGQYGSMHVAGTYLGVGLIAGIKSKETAAYNAGYKLGQKAAQGVKDGEDAHSPSREGIEAGEWLGEGLVIGILRMAKKVGEAGYGLGNGAVNSLSKAMVGVKDLLSEDMDTQPTIIPVLDLSDVKSGVGSISGLFNTRPSLGLMTNVGAISSMVNGRQNGANDDVVAAVNKLRKGLDNVGNTTYVIDGITYDDGSNISNAVQSLVRAARVERRV